MSAIERLWTHFPGTRYSQDALVARLPDWLRPDRIPLAEQLFRRSAVRSRHLVLTPDELVAHGRTFAEKNALYRATIRDAVGALCERIRAATGPRLRDSIALLVTASCTGFQIPAMDALVIRELGLPLDVRRINLTEHGCSAGAAAIGLAHEWLAANAARRALVVCAELCSLAFQPDDTSNENLVSAAIFGDGAAAALVAGDRATPPVDSERPLVRIRDTYREFFPATEHFMGFDVNEAGLKILLSRDVVTFSRTELPGLFARACARWNLRGPSAFEIGSVHPGGRRILEVLEGEVGLAREVTRTAWETLADCGNLSSVTVLVALERLLARPECLRPRARGVLSAFGPGFGAELALLEVGGAGI